MPALPGEPSLPLWELAGAPGSALELDEAPEEDVVSLPVLDEEGQEGKLEELSNFFPT